MRQKPTKTNADILSKWQKQLDKLEAPNMRIDNIHKTINFQSIDFIEVFIIYHFISDNIIILSKRSIFESSIYSTAHERRGVEAMLSIYHFITLLRRGRTPLRSKGNFPLTVGLAKEKKKWSAGAE